MSLQGRCLCGGVTYSIQGELPTEDGDLPLPVFCHCRTCQLLTGGAFFASSMVSTSQLTVATGSELLRRYESRPGVFRSFCSQCGRIYFSLGTVDGFATKPRAHIFVSRKAPWYDINDDLPRFDEYP